jgi:hypothetical protein
MCVQVTKTANRFEISSLLEKILLKQVRWCLTFVGLTIQKKTGNIGLYMADIIISSNFKIRCKHIYTVRQKLSATWLVSIIFFLIMNCQQLATFLIWLIFAAPYQANRKLNLKLYTQKISFRSQTHMLKSTRGTILIMNLFQIGLLFSIHVHTYLLTCETGYWSNFIYVYMTGCVKCHV